MLVIWGFFVKQVSRYSGYFTTHTCVCKYFDKNKNWSTTTNEYVHSEWFKRTVTRFEPIMFFFSWCFTWIKKCLVWVLFMLYQVWKGYLVASMNRFVIIVYINITSLYIVCHRSFRKKKGILYFKLFVNKKKMTSVSFTKQWILTSVYRLFLI